MKQFDFVIAGAGPAGCVLANRLSADPGAVPGNGVQTDQEIIDAALTMGSCGYHAIGTCAMGPNDDDVVDPRLRVRGVANLRVDAYRTDARVWTACAEAGVNATGTVRASPSRPPHHAIWLSCRRSSR